MPDNAETVRCSVVVEGPPWWTMPDLNEPRCLAPAAGERGGFPMCAEHMDLFNPAHNDDPAQSSTPVGEAFPTEEAPCPTVITPTTTVMSTTTMTTTPNTTITIATLATQPRSHTALAIRARTSTARLPTALAPSATTSACS